MNDHSSYTVIIGETMQLFALPTVQSDPFELQKQHPLSAISYHNLIRRS